MEAALAANLITALKFEQKNCPNANKEPLQSLKTMKQVISNHKNKPRNFPNQSRTANNCTTQQIRIQKCIRHGKNQPQGQDKVLGPVLGPQNTTCTKIKNGWFWRRQASFTILSESSDFAKERITPCMGPAWHTASPALGSHNLGFWLSVQAILQEVANVKAPAGARTIPLSMLWNDFWTRIRQAIQLFGILKALEGVWLFLKGFGSRDQVCCSRSLEEYRNLGLQESMRTTTRHADGGYDTPMESCLFVFLEAKLAADLITTARSLHVLMVSIVRSQMAKC